MWKFFANCELQIFISESREINQFTCVYEFASGFPMKNFKNDEGVQIEEMIYYFFRKEDKVKKDKHHHHHHDHDDHDHHHHDLGITDKDFGGVEEEDKEMGSFLNILKNYKNSYEENNKQDPKKKLKSNNIKSSIEISNPILQAGGIKNDQIEMIFSIEKRSERNYVPQFEPLSEEEILAGTRDDIG